MLGCYGSLVRLMRLRQSVLVFVNRASIRHAPPELAPCLRFALFYESYLRMFLSSQASLGSANLLPLSHGVIPLEVVSVRVAQPSNILIPLAATLGQAASAKPQRTNLGLDGQPNR
jgi:hypothetical protein